MSLFIPYKDSKKREKTFLSRVTAHGRKSGPEPSRQAGLDLYLLSEQLFAISSSGAVSE
jgi:hypothetical protein